MIILIPAKDFVKKAKKFYKARETHIINGSDNAEVTKIGEGDNPIADLIPTKSILRGEEKMSKGEISEKVKRFIKSEGVTRAFGMAIAYQLKEPDSNVFIILNKKTYEGVGDKLIKRFNKITDLDDGDIILKWTDWDIILGWYRRHVERVLDKTNDKYDKLRYDGTKALRDKSDKLEDLNDRLDKLEDAYESPDKVEAQKAFIKEAKFSKDTTKKLKKFMEKNEGVLAVKDEINLDRYMT